MIKVLLILQIALLSCCYASRFETEFELFKARFAKSYDSEEEVRHSEKSVLYSII